MTSTEWLALGQRAVKAPGSRWMPGMLLMDGRRIHEVCGACLLVYKPSVNAVVRYESEPEPSLSYGCAIDLRDPATRGCLLELVREKHGQDIGLLQLTWGRKKVLGWSCTGALHLSAAAVRAPTEAEALVKTLELPCLST